MAYADYRHCDVCDVKVFYDSNLDYEQGSDVPEEEMAKIVGIPHPTYGYRLHNLGDWAVLCRACAKSHRTAIIDIEGYVL